MVITPTECPSNGLDTDSQSIDLRPLGYQDLLLYSHELASVDNPIARFNIDFKWFRQYVPNWKSINIVDLEYVMFRWKLNSISPDSEFNIKLKCPTCNHTEDFSLDLSMLDKPKTIDFYLGGTVKLGNPESTYEYKCCSSEVFFDVLNKCTRSRRVTSIDTIKLISLFTDFKSNPNLIERLVLDAKYDDVRVLESLKALYLNTRIKLRINCPKCNGGDWSMRASSLIDDPFLVMVQSEKSIESKIAVKQIR